MRGGRVPAGGIGPSDPDFRPATSAQVAEQRRVGQCTALESLCDEDWHEGAEPWVGHDGLMNVPARRVVFGLRAPL